MSSVLGLAEQALLLELVHRFHGLEQLGHIASLLGAAQPGQMNWKPMRTRSMSAPSRSARLASSFMNEILVANMALGAGRELPITMRSGFWKSATGDPSLRNSGFDTTSNGIATPRACCSARMAVATLRRHGCSPS